MLNWKDITMDSKTVLEPYIMRSNLKSCEANFSTIFIWGGQLNVRYAECENFCLVGYEREGNLFAYPPFGEGNFAAAVRELVSYCREKKIGLRFVHVEEEQAKRFERELGDLFTVTDYRDFYDYLYSREKMETLAGKKYHGKRGHLKKFYAQYDYSFEPITEADFDTVKEINYEWCRQKGTCAEKSEINERCAVKKLLDNFHALGAFGGMIRIEEKPVAFTIATRLFSGSDIANVHFEKAIGDYQGLFPAINQLFVKSMPEDIQWINREDDMGLPGLRKAKLSYYPEILLQKYQVTLND